MCWLALAVTFVFVAVSAFMPGRRLWGVNHLAFFSEPVRIAALLIAAVFFVPAVAARSWRGFSRFAERFSRSLGSGVNTIALSSVCAFIVFAAFRSSTLLFGDGFFIANTFREAAERGVGLAKFFTLVTVEERTYQATEFLNYAASRAAAAAGAVSPVSGVWMLNCLVGAVFVAGLLVVLKRRGSPAALYVAAAALIGLSGAVELFFGYVESYTPVLVLGALYVVVSHRALRDGSSVIFPATVLAVAVIFHIQALLLLPSLICLVVWRAVDKKKPRRSAWVAPSIAALTLVSVVIAGQTDAYRHYFLSPVGTGAGGAYGVFSAAHVADAFNELALLCPMWLFFVALGIRRAVTRRGRERAYPRGEPGFGWCLLVPSILFLALFYPERGMARDWGLYALTAIGLFTPGLLVMRHLWRSADKLGDARILLPPALALSALVAVPWIGVNAGATKSVERYQRILSYDHTNAAYAYEALAGHYGDRFNFSGQIGALQRAHTITGNPRYLAMIGRVFYENGDFPNAARNLRAAVRDRPDFTDARKLLIEVLAERGSSEEIIAVCRAGIALSPDVPFYHFMLGRALLQRGDVEGGLTALENCSKLDPPPAMSRDIERLIDAARESRRGEDRR